MNPKIYQDEAHKFATYGNNPMYPALGLAEEAGEACGKLAKFIRKHDGIAPMVNEADIEKAMKMGFVNADFTEDAKKFQRDLSKELGDVCWMLAELCTIYCLDLEEVMEENIAKLTDRLNRGVIVGEGDNR